MDNFFETHGEFITLEMTDSINADSLISVIKGVLKDHSLSVSKLGDSLKQKLPSQGWRNVFTTGPAKSDHEDYAIKCVGGRQLHEL